MEKVVVTGGAGFIGSNLSDELDSRGYKVVVLDDLSAGKLENVAPLLAKGNAEFVLGSVTDALLLQQVFKGAKYVFHLGAIAGVVQSVEDPLASHEVNLTGTLNVLIAARDSGVKKVVFSSSAAVYGSSPTMPKREDMLPQPESPYAVTKLAGEEYCHVFRRAYGLQTACLRYFNIFGPRQDPNSQYAAAIPGIAKKVAQGEPPVIYGDGEQTRDFVFVKDAVAANCQAALSDACGVFNVGRGTGISINRLARLIISLMGVKMEPLYGEMRPGDIRHSLSDISRAAEAFGYSPKYSLEEGLRQTLAGFGCPVCR